MRALIFASLTLATAPILALNAMPKSNERILAVFETEQSMTDILRKSKHLGLDVISYDQKFSHVIVQDHDGGSAMALYGLGARFVVDADLFSCRPLTSDNT